MTVINTESKYILWFIINKDNIWAESRCFVRYRIYSYWKFILLCLWSLYI